MSSPLAPRFWGGHLVMVVLLAAAILLGVWQVHVYERHRAEAAINRTHDQPVALAAAIGPDQAFPGDAVGRPVTISGGWLPQDTVLVSGQQQGGRTGFWVVTPVSVTGTRSALPVVLGWTPDVSSAPDPPSGAARLTAWLQPSQADAEVAAAQTRDARFDVLPDLQTAELAQDVSQDLYDGYAVAENGVAGLAQAELPQPPATGILTSIRNLLYGIQWWVFGGFAVLIWWRWLADARASDASVEASGGDRGGDGGGDEDGDEDGDPDRDGADDAPVGTVKA